MKRVNGYYWVYYRSEWVIAEWWNTIWIKGGLGMDIPENSFTEINETRILSPDEKTKS